MSVRDRQIEAIRSMLNLSGTDNSDPTWKVLIYDKTGQSVIGPLLSVGELRELGVTLHLPLHSERDSIPEAPAVYFCLPTEENIHRICQDLNNNLYGTYYYNFISPINRQKLEDIATASLQSNTVSQIQKLYDQYVNFICLEGEMFCLKQPKDSTISYYNLNRGSVTDTEMEEMLDTVTESLFSLCVTLGTVPIIRCPKGNAAEAVAEKLDKKLRDNLKDARNSLFGSDGAASGRYSFHRPVLVLVDRSVDMATPLHHTWTYQAMAHDVLPYNQNRVTVPGGEGVGGAKKKDKEYELNHADEFWDKHKGAPFPQVAEAIQESLEEIKAKQEDIQRMKTDLGISGDAEAEAAIGGLSLSDNTAKLSSAVTDLPRLLEQKRLIDMHTSLATSLLEFIKKRRLDVFFELEEKIMSGATLDKSINEIINDPENGEPDDKLRLFLIYFLCTNTITDAEFDQYSSTLQNNGCNLAAINYLKRWKSFSMIGSKNIEFSQGQGMTTTKSVSMFSKLMEKSSNFVMEGVKNLVVKKHDLPVTKIVDDIMEQRTGKFNDEYRYLDPKILRGGDSIPRSKTTYNDAIVFVVGGGNYIEYQNLRDYVKAKNTGNPGAGKRVVYGCTQVCSATQFLAQIKQLGTEM